MNRKAFLDHLIGLSKGALDIAVGEGVVPQNIAFQLFKHHRGIWLDGLFRMDHCGERLVFDLYQIQHILGCCPVYGCNGHHRLAHIAHLFIG